MKYIVFDDFPYLSTAIAMIVREDIYAATHGNVFTSLQVGRDALKGI